MKHWTLWKINILPDKHFLYYHTALGMQINFTWNIHKVFYPMLNNYLTKRVKIRAIQIGSREDIVRLQ